MDNSNVNIDLIRGHVDTIILRSIFNEDKYGLEILSYIKEKSGNMYSLKQPTLYSCLKRLEKIGYIGSYKGDTSNGAKRVYYTLLPEGRNFVLQDQYQWEFSRTIIDNLLSDKDFDPNQKPPFNPSEFRPLTRRQSNKNDDSIFFEQVDDKLIYDNDLPYSNNENNSIENDDASDFVPSFQSSKSVNNDFIAKSSANSELNQNTDSEIYSSKNHDGTSNSMQNQDIDSVTHSAPNQVGTANSMQNQEIDSVTHSAPNSAGTANSRLNQDIDSVTHSAPNQVGTANSKQSQNSNFSLFSAQKSNINEDFKQESIAEKINDKTREFDNRFPTGDIDNDICPKFCNPTIQYENKIKEIFFTDNVSSKNIANENVDDFNNSIQPKSNRNLQDLNGQDTHSSFAQCAKDDNNAKYTQDLNRQDTHSSFAQCAQDDNNAKYTQDLDGQGTRNSFAQCAQDDNNSKYEQDNNVLYSQNTDQNYSINSNSRFLQDEKNQSTQNINSNFYANNYEKANYNDFEKNISSTDVGQNIQNVHTNYNDDYFEKNKNSTFSKSNDANDFDSNLSNNEPDEKINGFGNYNFVQPKKETQKTDAKKHTNFLDELLKADSKKDNNGSKSVNYIQSFSEIYSNSQQTVPLCHNENVYGGECEYLTTNELKNKFNNEGYSLKPYQKNNTTAYFANKYYFQSKVLFFSSMIFYILMAIEGVIIYLATKSYLPNQLNFLIICLTLPIIYPIFSTIKLSFNPKFRKPTNFNLKSAMTTAMIFVINAGIIIVCLAFLVFKSTFSDINSLINPLILPLCLLINVPAAILIYQLLYSSKRFFIR